MIHLVNVESHGRDHVCKAGCFRKIGYNFVTLDTGIVDFVNQEWLDDDKNLVDIWVCKEVIELYRTWSISLTSKCHSWSLRVRSMSKGKILSKSNPALKWWTLFVIGLSAILDL